MDDQRVQGGGAGGADAGLLRQRITRRSVSARQPNGSWRSPPPAGPLPANPTAPPAPVDGDPDAGATLTAALVMAGRLQSEVDYLRERLTAGEREREDLRRLLADAMLVLDDQQHQKRPWWRF